MSQTDDRLAVPTARSLSLTGEAGVKRCLDRVDYHADLAVGSHDHVPVRIHLVERLELAELARRDLGRRIGYPPRLALPAPGALGHNRCMVDIRPARVADVLATIA